MTKELRENDIWRTAGSSTKKPGLRVVSIANGRYYWFDERRWRPASARIEDFPKVFRTLLWRGDEPIEVIIE